jgi:hypothetical protein
MIFKNLQKDKKEYLTLSYLFKSLTHVIYQALLESGKFGVDLMSKPCLLL